MFNVNIDKLCGVVNMVIRDGIQICTISGATSSFYTNSTDSNGDEILADYRLVSIAVRI